MMTKTARKGKLSSLIPASLVVLPTAAILLIVLAASVTPQTAVAAPPAVAQAPAQAGPACESCHPEEAVIWRESTHASATLDPAFQQELAKAENQDACLKCHTTGFDTGTGTFMAEGVTCEACHGTYKAGHPAAETMALPMESETCHMCHKPAFDEWEASGHAAQNIECFDCHLAHTQGLRTGSQEKLCGACHSDRQTQVAHTRHGISGVECTSCHMAMETRETGNPTGVTVEATSHSFQVTADVCNGCHASTIHSSAPIQVSSNRTSGPASIAAAEPKAERRIEELEAQVVELEEGNNRARELAVAGMGLTFGAGGFMGLAAGLVVMALWRKGRRLP